MTNDKVNLLDFDRRDLEAFFIARGEKAFRAAQVMKWIFREGVTDFDAMTDLSKGLREQLKESAEIRPPPMLMTYTSQDSSCKWLIRVDSGNCIETVFIPEAGRGTLCVSSQVGCALNCSFCATAQQGFNRNLGVAEIIGQVWQAKGAGKGIERLLDGLLLISLVLVHAPDKTRSGRAGRFHRRRQHRVIVRGERPVIRPIGAIVVDQAHGIGRVRRP